MVSGRHRPASLSVAAFTLRPVLLQGLEGCALESALKQQVGVELPPVPITAAMGGPGATLRRLACPGPAY